MPVEPPSGDSPEGSWLGSAIRSSEAQRRLPPLGTAVAQVADRDQAQSVTLATPPRAREDAADAELVTPPKRRRLTFKQAVAAAPEEATAHERDLQRAVERFTYMEALLSAAGWQVPEQLEPKLYHRVANKAVSYTHLTLPTRLSV